MKPHLQRIHAWTLALLTALVICTPAGAAEEGTTGEAPAYTPKGSVARSAFTTAIVDREPVDNLVRVPNDVPRIYFFSDLRHLEGEIVTHRWEYDGKVMAEVKFRVGGPRWRVYSSKNLLPAWTGKWTVVVLDQAGWPLKAAMFEYVDATEAATPADQPTP